MYPACQRLLVPLVNIRLRVPTRCYNHLARRTTSSHLDHKPPVVRHQRVRREIVQEQERRKARLSQSQTPQIKTRLIERQQMHHVVRHRCHRHLRNFTCDHSHIQHTPKTTLRKTQPTHSLPTRFFFFTKIMIIHHHHQTTKETPQQQQPQQKPP